MKDAEQLKRLTEHYKRLMLGTLSSLPNPVDADWKLTNEHWKNFECEGKKPDDVKVTENLWREQLGDIESYTYCSIKGGQTPRRLSEDQGKRIKNTLKTW